MWTSPVSLFFIERTCNIMPSRKGFEQAITWLRSKMAEGDTLDAINAELTYNVMLDLKAKREKIGVLYYQSNLANRLAQERIKQIEDLRYEIPKRGIQDLTEEPGDLM